MRLVFSALVVGAALTGLGLTQAHADSSLIPNDPLYAANEWYSPKMNLPQAWGISTGSTSVTVAVLDTGVDPNTPDLAGRVLPALTENGTGSPYNGDGLWYHGTSVATAVAGGVNNGIGGTGVGNFKILPITICDYQTHASASWIAAGITDAANAGAKVINISYSSSDYGSLNTAAGYARSKGALTFVAAGNNNGLDSTIATTYSNLIFVAGTNRDSNGNVIPWQNTVVNGVNTGTSYGPYVNISAPAYGVVTWNTQNTPYQYMGGVGTSYAAPLAAGAAALAWSINPNLTPDQVQNMMMSTALPFNVPINEQGYFGAGELNIGGVAQAAEASLGVPEPTSLALVGLSAIWLLPRRRPNRR